MNKPNQGALFKNTEKPEGSKQPDYSGPFTDANGREMRIAAWLSKSKDGRPYLSVKVSEPFVPDNQAPQPKPVDAPPSDEIPF